VDLDEVLAATFSLVAPHLTERQRRLLFGAAARALGPGGVSRVARLAEASRPTVRRGVAELDQPADPRGRIRQHQGPRRLRDRDPGLLQGLDRLVEPDTRGDPDSPLRWTCKSTRELAQALTATGCSVRPRPWRAPSIPTGTPSSATSTSRRRSIWPLGNRW
jgi:Rhodopirellula transposase DDE domain